MNKKEYRKLLAAHRQALVDGRAVRLTDDDGNRSIRTFPTWEAAEEFLARVEASGLMAEQLTVSLEEQAESLGLPGVPEHWRQS